MSGYVWRDEELDILKEYYPIGGYELCMKKGINRTRDAIVKKANILTIKTKMTGGRVGYGVWTDDEIEVVKEYYAKYGKEKVHELIPNRSMVSIVSRAYKLGITREYSDNKYKEWSEEEVSILTKYIGREGIKGCIKRGVNRSYKSIHKKAKLLGLKVKLEKMCRQSFLWSDEELDILKKYYKKGGYSLCMEKGLNRTKSSIRCKASRLNLSYNYK